MLNLSPQRVLGNVKGMGLTSLEQVDLPTGQKMFRRLIVGFALFGLIMLLMPWTQNFRAKGTVTALNPADRPQTINASIAGRVEAWFVMEGDTVQTGDTIARISEIYTDYLDPAIADRTGEAKDAKSNSAIGYQEKAAALGRQIVSLRQEAALKREQNENKLEQSYLYVSTLEADEEQQQTQVDIADYQFRRSDSLYQSGLKSLTYLEGKRLKQRETRAKLTGIQNKLEQSKTDIQQARIALESVGPAYRNKIAKAESDRQSAITSYYGSVGEVAKLRTQEASYRLRLDFHYILAPQPAVIARVLKPGLGETVKEGEAVVSILSANFKPAVEIYIEPFNLPLVQNGEEVRFLFDGWPAIFFSGWPDMSYGTFVGEVVAIDNIIDKKGRYRVLVQSDDDGRPWPEALRPGSGAEGVVLLGNVPVWYELWRQLNAFPPDYYEDQNADEKAGKQDKVKRKAPVKGVIK
jgi:adhesin transport system membrane fusion protein